MRCESDWLDPENPQLRDSAGFAPDFAAAASPRCVGAKVTLADEVGGVEWSIPSTIRSSHRVGVSIGRPSDGETWAQTSAQVESCGFHSLWVADHLVDGLYSPFYCAGVGGGGDRAPRRSALVLANDFRHPVIVAREAATLASLSDGRFVLGLGAGHMKSEYDERPASPTTTTGPRRSVHRGGRGSTPSATAPRSTTRAHYRVSGTRCHRPCGSRCSSAATVRVC